MKKNYIIAAVIFVSMATVVYAHIKGQPGYTKKNGSQGCSCHNTTKSDSVQVTIGGPSKVIAGEKAQYEILVYKKKSEVAGFNASTKNGTLQPTKDGLTVTKAGELMHSKPKDADLYDISRWKVVYVAPAKGDVIDTLFTAGLAGNGDGKEGGDNWNFGTAFPITIVSRGIPATVYNPDEIFQASLFQRELEASPILDIEMLVDDTLKVEIFTSAGKSVTMIKNERLSKGQHMVPIPSGPLDGGEYFARITVRDMTDKLRFTIKK
ncbi:MAG TPA: choice-of-anchor V domain-containing protein [Candidatus Kapabacteria bacterium]